MRVRGREAVLRFSHVADGLRVDGDILRGFAVRGAEGPWVWADARVEGETVVVHADGVTQPVAVRYAWSDNPLGNLRNSSGLPASPFRTDIAVNVAESDH